MTQDKSIQSSTIQGSRLKYVLTLVAMAQYIHVLSNINVEIITLKIVLK